MTKNIEPRHYDVILSPVVTEKATIASEHNKVLFKVAAKATKPQKIGSFNKDTFGCYYLNGELFIKRYQADTSKTYPDMGASFETFTNADMLESETMGPLTKLAPGATVEHVEGWTLHKGVKIGSWTDAELDRVVAPLVKTGR